MDNIDKTLRPDTPMATDMQSMTGAIPDSDTTLRTQTDMFSTARTANALQGGSVQSGAVRNVGDYFYIRGEYYTKLETLSDNSGEAQVFLVEKDGVKQVLKVYYPKFKVKKKLMKLVSTINFEMIVRTHDFGKLYVDGVHRDYELMEYLEGGTLDKFKINGDMDAFRRLALQAAAALEYCHNLKIIHKDIKPGNFFFRDSEHTQLVLGDFGISSLTDENQAVHRTTQARTPVYASPEMYSDVIDGVVELTPATDYYSLGITLLALWLGHSPFTNSERTIMKYKNEGRLPKVDNLPDRVRMIIKGLTAVNIQTRWKYKEVERWFLGESPRVDESSPFLKYKAFVVDPERNLVAQNASELVPMLLNNERVARGYLYGGRLANWFEQCGNEKVSIALKDIVKNRYPADPQAGLTAAIYAMEPTWAYRDVNNKECIDIHSVALSIITNMSEYMVVLRNPHDRLWIYLESRTNCDVERMRKYFSQNDNSQKTMSLAVMRTVYEIDKDMPFLVKYNTKTLQDIVRCFGNEQLSENDWRSLTDGRLLSWMYNHEDRMACEALRILTEGKDFSRHLAYKVLYNIDRTAAYDLKEADTPKKVGEMLVDKLMKWQSLPEAEFTEVMSEFTDPDGRFMYFAQMHGWVTEMVEAQKCFDLNADENRQRLGVYDLRTAAYRFCRILGAVPTYALPSGKILKNGLDIDKKYTAEVRNEVRQGVLSQWLTAFYHENPLEEFTEEFSYERRLEDWLNAVGNYDPQYVFYRRFIQAKNDTKQKYDHVKKKFTETQLKRNVWRFMYFGLCMVWILAVLILGFEKKEEMLLNGMLTVCAPVGGITALICGVKAFFRGYGFVMCVLWGSFGFLTSLLPLWVLRYVDANMPSMFTATVIVITLLYMVICHFSENRSEKTFDKEFINEVIDDDVKSLLLEPLYYTFKTKAYKFNGSKFSVLEDVENQFTTVASESFIHYVMWTVMIVALIIELLVYNSVI